ncbi:hypothetical protein [Litoreibacter janthinus]|uniref:Uncharacterized protein n=1 Tax=Litoreibacter janthinus TaxID=670154 RepID=A0A1I6H4C9_9RHOB|nr:hypothetical protein [Litoreibacter janthinus]SFR49315.1 hypothetical protein SAMN04488002_2500 [Litoreibacter janthinus]
MVEIGLEIANPNIKAEETQNGYRLQAIESRTVVARFFRIVFALFGLAFLAAGVVVWVLPDDVFQGDPFSLKVIVTVATWLVFGPIVWFSFIAPTTNATEVDLEARVVHQITLNKRGEPIKQRSIPFDNVMGLDFVRNTSAVTENELPGYGQIYLRLSKNKGVSLIWGERRDLEAVLTKLRADITNT